MITIRLLPDVDENRIDKYKIDTKLQQTQTVKLLSVMQIILFLERALFFFCLGF